MFIWILVAIQVFQLVFLLRYFREANRFRINQLALVKELIAEREELEVSNIKLQLQLEQERQRRPIDV